MARYASRPRGYTDADNDGYWPDGACEHVEVEMNYDQPTGILDASGNEIWRLREPAGFDLSDSRSHIKRISKKRADALRRLADR